MPQQHKSLHMITEGLAIFILAPYLLYLSLTQHLNIFHRIALIIIVILTLIIDGYFLIQWYLDNSNILHPNVKFIKNVNIKKM